MQSETEFQFEYIRADGGVARNDFVLQTIANLTGKRVERPTTTEATALGCALMAGLHAGIWSSREKVQSFYRVEKIFLPRTEQEELAQNSFQEWERAMERFLKWSKDSE
jgi:glycerol kinase